MNVANRMGLPSSDHHEDADIRSVMVSDLDRVETLATTGIGCQKRRKKEKTK